MPIVAAKVKAADGFHGNGWEPGSAEILSAMGNRHPVGMMDIMSMAPSVQNERPPYGACPAAFGSTRKIPE
jgi:hypothetical protein